MNGTEGKPKVPLYLLGGFLGSGKTSLLNSILSLYEGRNAGVIINEFGDLNVDASLIPSGSEIKVSELNGGQIFCSCLSGSFIKSIAAYKGMNIDILIVEASGLTKPAPLQEIIQLASKAGDEFFEYRGMIGVVDAERFEILDQTLMTLGEQISYSDHILINKIDLVDGETVSRIEKRVLELNPEAAVMTTTFGTVPKEFLENLNPSSVTKSKADRKKWAGWGKAGRPIPMTLLPEAPVAVETLENFLKKTAPGTFRMKGFLKSTSGSTLLVDYTGPSGSVSETVTEKTAETGLVLLLPGDSSFPAEAASVWEEITGVAAMVRS